jgi:urate oxidase
MAVVGANQYGKAESRVVRIVRDVDHPERRHEIVDLNVSTSLRGDFADAHVTGDQSAVLPTDTQKNTAFAYAKLHGVSSIEDYALALGRRLVEATPTATSAQVRVEEYAWDRLGDHAFVRRGQEVRTCVVTVGRGSTHVLSGLQDLVLLKSAGSEFKGFLTDEFTTLAETDDRILATSLVARWRHDDLDQREGPDWNASYVAARQLLLSTFATTYSRALQETLFLMGSAVVDTLPGIAEIRFSAPNRHHFLVDFSRFEVPGLSNDGEVFIAADRPYGLIECQVSRDDAPPAGDAWLAVPGFC